MSLEGQAQADISVVSCQELGRAWLLCYGREAPASVSLWPFFLLELHTFCFTGSVGFGAHVTQTRRRRSKRLHFFLCLTLFTWEAEMLTVPV